MKVRSYAFQADPMYAYMEKLSVDFDVPLHNDITLKLPVDMGTGFIKNIFFENGCCIRYYNFSVKNSMPFHWFYETESGELLYKLIFTCGADPLTPADENFTAPDGNTKPPAVLYMADPGAAQILPAGTLVTRIALLFTQPWLEENFPGASLKIARMVKLPSSNHPPSFITEAMGHSYYTLVKEMIKEMDKDIFPVIPIKTKSLELLNEFLNKVVESIDAENIERKILYSDTINRVEKRLCEFLLTSMPGIAQLSAEFNMSPSTLQRHFKVVYGKNIYQYYLIQKLAIGKALIASKKNTISEVAHMLGYNKINSFSRVFKKYFGVLPKDVNALNKEHSKARK